MLTIHKFTTPIDETARVIPSLSPIVVLVYNKRHAVLQYKASRVSEPEYQNVTDEIDRVAVCHAYMRHEPFTTPQVVATINLWHKMESQTHKRSVDTCEVVSWFNFDFGDEMAFEEQTIVWK